MAKKSSTDDRLWTGVKSMLGPPENDHITVEKVVAETGWSKGKSSEYVRRARMHMIHEYFTDQAKTDMKFSWLWFAVAVIALGVARNVKIDMDPEVLMLAPLFFAAGGVYLIFKSIKTRFQRRSRVGGPLPPVPHQDQEFINTK